MQTSRQWPSTSVRAQSNDERMTVEREVSARLFPESFAVDRFEASAAEIHFVQGLKEGKPPLLLLHGFPQTHAMWHKVAGRLAEQFHVIAPDLRGYGDSSRPPSAANHETYSKRAMAQDAIELMAHLGYRQFHVAGHDRGARVTHRLCLDHARNVLSACVMDIVPTRFMFEQTDRALATVYYHWFFLQQPEPLPECLIAAEPGLFLDRCLDGWSRSGRDAFDPRARAEYLRCFSKYETVHAACEDYRAAGSIDLEHDTADAQRRIQCPLLVLWGGRGFV